MSAAEILESEKHLWVSEVLRQGRLIDAVPLDVLGLPQGAWSQEKLDEARRRTIRLILRLYTADENLANVIPQAQLRKGVEEAFIALTKGEGLRITEPPLRPPVISTPVPVAQPSPIGSPAPLPPPPSGEDVIATVKLIAPEILGTSLSPTTIVTSDQVAAFAERVASRLSVSADFVRRDVQKALDTYSRERLVRSVAGDLQRFSMVAQQLSKEHRDKLAPNEIYRRQFDDRLGLLTKNFSLSIPLAESVMNEAMAMAGLKISNAGWPGDTKPSIFSKLFGR